MKTRQIIRLAMLPLALIGATLGLAQTPAARPTDSKTTAALPTIEPPDWLFPHPPKPLPSPAVKTPQSKKTAEPKPAAEELLGIPDSAETFPLSRINDPFDPPDWRPNSHGPMPDVVSKGRKPAVMACAFCHTPSGQGRPENASLAGLSEGYIRQQLLDYRGGRRKGVGPDTYLPTHNMIQTAKAMTDQEIDASAKYFSQQKLKRRVYVIESLRIPRAEPAAWIYQEYSGTEDLGDRLLEVTQDLVRHERRDDRLEYLAYVPPGAINRGKRLVTAGKSAADNQDRTVPCTQCHLANLKGQGDIPPISGRSPTYLLRQLIAFRNGLRVNEASVQMNPVVEKLTLNEMIDIVAYVSSLPP